MIKLVERCIHADGLYKRRKKNKDISKYNIIELTREERKYI